MSLITFSILLGAGGNAVCEAVAAALGYPIYDDLALTRVAQKIGFHDEDLGLLEQDKPSFFERIRPSHRLLVIEFLESLVYEAASSGNAILTGHGAQVMLNKFECALHVQVRAPFSTRVERVARKMEIDPAEAEKLVLKHDRQHSGFLNYFFHCEQDSPDLYDIVINTGKMSYETATRLVVESARATESCTTDIRTTLDRMSLTTRAEAKLMKVVADPFTLTVRSPEPGVVEVAGWIVKDREEQAIRKVLEDTPEIEQVRLNLRVRPSDE